MIKNSSDSTTASPTHATAAAPRWDGPAHDLQTLLAIMKALRDPQSGCPWDIEQDFASIAPYTLEEVYEVTDAIARGNMEDLCEELGDLLLQVVFHAQMASEVGSFTFADVVAAISTKMIRRHPHVFGDIDRDDAQAVKHRWEAIKAQEKEEKRARQNEPGQAAQQPASALDGVPTTLPATKRALKLQQKAARVGFDWPNAEQVMEKLAEESEEVAAELVRKPLDRHRLEDEVGDLLFVAVNLARKLDIDPDAALERTNRKFIQRFQSIERELSETSTPVGRADLQTMEAAWQRAKRSG